MKLIVGVMAIVAAGTVAHAAPNLEFSIGLCAAKPDSAARLACFDAIAAKLQSGEAIAAAPAAVTPAATPVVPAAPAAPVSAPAPAPAVTPAAPPEARFGAETLAKESQKAAGQPEQIDEIHAVISQLAFAANGRAIVTLENGQVWRQIDGDTSPFRGKQGEKATIERSLFGSYSLTVEGHNMLIKVNRVR